MMPGRGRRRSKVCNGCPIMPLGQRRERCYFVKLNKNGYVLLCNLGLWKRTWRGGLECHYSDMDVLHMEKILATVEDDRARTILVHYLSRVDKQAEMGALQIKA